jgi:hypothetical protein
MLYPEESRILQIVSHDSSKRPDPNRLMLVYQCRPAWSRVRLERGETEWSREVLDEAGSILGRWAASPDLIQPHRWTLARLEGRPGLALPYLSELSNGSRLALSGELFSPEAGAEGAFLSGLRLADRLTERSAGGGG